MKSAMASRKGIPGTYLYSEIFYGGQKLHKYFCSSRVLGRNEILYKNLDLAQDFPNKILFHFLLVKMLPKNSSKIFRWPEMCPLAW